MCLGSGLFSIYSMFPDLTTVMTVTAECSQHICTGDDIFILLTLAHFVNSVM